MNEVYRENMTIVGALVAIVSGVMFGVEINTPPETLNHVLTSVVGLVGTGLGAAMAVYAQLYIPGDESQRIL